MQMQQELYRALQQHEALKQQQEEQKRQIAANTGFYARVQHMSYDLNGLPLYPLKVAAPPGEQFNEVRYKETLKRESNISLVKTVKTAPPRKQIVTTTGLKQSTLTVTEVLSRGGHPPKNGGAKTRAPAFNAKAKSGLIKVKTQPVVVHHK